MPLFLTDEEYNICSHDAALVAQKADSFISIMLKELEILRSQADCASLAHEQNCTVLEHKFRSLADEFSRVKAENTELQRLSSHSDQIQSEKQQLHLQLVAKDGELESLSLEISELHKTKKRLLDIIGRKDEDASDKNATIQTCLEKISSLGNEASLRQAHLNDMEAELHRSGNAFHRLSQEKELIACHNAWLNEELNSKLKRVNELSMSYSELELEFSSKLNDAEKKQEQCSESLQWNKQKVKEIETELSVSQEDYRLLKATASSTEAHLNSEIQTANKLVDLYKESSEEWSKKATDLEAVIKALEMHLNQVKADYGRRLEQDESAKQLSEMEIGELKQKITKLVSEQEERSRAIELRPFTLTSSIDFFPEGTPDDEGIAGAISETAFAASLLRDGWNLTRMHRKYEESVDAFRHEREARIQAESFLTRILYEVEKKAKLISEERIEHEKIVESYVEMHENLQHVLSGRAQLERTIRDLTVELKMQERVCAKSEKEIRDLKKQVTVLLKECRDVHAGHGGSVLLADADDDEDSNIDESEADAVISEHLLTFTDIHGLVDQNAKLRSLARVLSSKIEKRESEFEEEMKLAEERITEEDASRIESLVERCKEQESMIESLRNSVETSRKKLEEECSGPSPTDTVVAPESASGEISSLRSERDGLITEGEFARRKLDSVVGELARVRDQSNALLSRNAEQSQLLMNLERERRGNDENARHARELVQKLTFEAALLVREKELACSSERSAGEEAARLSEDLNRARSRLDAATARENASGAERKRLEDRADHVERERVETHKQLQLERENVGHLTRSLVDVARGLDGLRNAIVDAEVRASLAESRCSELEKKKIADGTGDEIQRLKSDAEASGERVVLLETTLRASEDEMKRREKLNDEIREMLRISEAESSGLRAVIALMESESVNTASAISAKEEATHLEFLSVTSSNAELTLRLAELDARVSELVSALETERRRSSASRDDYERQVALHSQCIEEVKRTSLELSELQRECSSTRELLESHDVERCKWELERSVLELASRHEEPNAVGGHRRLNEWEPEKSSMRAELETAREETRSLRDALLLKSSSLSCSSAAADGDSESGSFAREVRMLREANARLAAENKQNYEESARARESASRTEAEIEKLEAALHAKEIEIGRESARNNIDGESAVRRIKELTEKNEAAVAERESVIADARAEMSAMDGKIAEMVATEASMRAEMEKQQKISGNLKKKLEEADRQVQSMSKQLDDGRQAGREKEKENAARIQTLESVVEKLRRERAAPPPPPPPVIQQQVRTPDPRLKPSPAPSPAPLSQQAPPETRKFRRLKRTFLTPTEEPRDGQGDTLEAHFDAHASKAVVTEADTKPTPPSLHKRSSECHHDDGAVMEVKRVRKEDDNDNDDGNDGDDADGDGAVVSNWAGPEQDDADGDDYVADGGDEDGNPATAEIVAPSEREEGELVDTDETSTPPASPLATIDALPDLSLT